MKVRVKRGAKSCARDAKGQIGAKMGHQVSPDEVLFRHGVPGEAGVFDRAKGKENFAARRHLGARFDTLILCPDGGDAISRALEAGYVGIVHQHQPLDRVLIVRRSTCGLGLTLGDAGGAQEQLYTIEFVEGEKSRTW